MKHSKSLRKKTLESLKVTLRMIFFKGGEPPFVGKDFPSFSEDEKAPETENKTSNGEIITGVPEKTDITIASKLTGWICIVFSSMFVTFSDYFYEVTVYHE